MPDPSDPTDPASTPSLTPEQALDSMPLCRLLGVEFRAAEAAEVRAVLAWSPERCTIGGALHGGAVMALADASGAVAAFLNLPEGALGTTTISSSTNFLRGVRSGHVEATSRAIHVGRTTIVVETAVTDSTGRLVAKVVQTQAVLR